MSKVVRGARQLNAAGASAAPSPAASELAILICDAVPALEAATRMTRCPVGQPHEAFMQGSLFEAAVRILMFHGPCSSDRGVVQSVIVRKQVRTWRLRGRQTAPCYPSSMALAQCPFCALTFTQTAGQCA